MAGEVPILSKLWREKQDIAILKNCSLDGSLEKVIGQLVHLAYCGSTKNSMFVKYLKDGLLKKILPPAFVIDSLSKLSLGKKPKCCSSAIEIISICARLLRYNNDDTSAAGVCTCLSKINFWLLENTIEVYKALYSCMEASTCENPNTWIELIEAAQDLLNKYIHSVDYEDLSFIGKLFYGEEEVPTVQLLIRDLLSLQLDKVATHPIYSLYESNLKDFMKYMTRFLNATPMYTQVERARGESPNKTIHAFLQIQVLNYLYVSSKKAADIYDNFIKVENIALEQFIFDVIRFTSHNILARENTLEKSLFISFLYIKFPLILKHLSQNYKQQNGYAEKAILYALQQLHQLHDISTVLNCDAVSLFLNQLLVNKVIDNKQMEHLSKFSAPSTELPVKDNNIIEIHINENKKCGEILSNLNLPYHDKKEGLDKELSSLINSADIMTTMVLLAASDHIDTLSTALLRINDASKRCTDGSQDTQHELRSELFNNTFQLLTYVHTLFGDKVFQNVVDDFPSSFYLKWMSNCQNIVCRKMFSQQVLDALMETILKNHAVSTSNACWDEYCWSVGMIVKEMTQAHLRRHINTESLQKICENFKNKRPSLCICAFVWLCTQYKSMPSSERSRVVKIINLFRRRHPNNVVRADFFAPIFTKYAADLGNDLNANQKEKTVPSTMLQSGAEKFQKIVEQLYTSSPIIWLSKDVIASLLAVRKLMSYEVFAENLLKLILNSGKEEDVKLYEKLCLCIILTDPVKILHTIFTRTLLALFHTTDIKNKFADPRGRSLSKCLSKAFYAALMISHIEKQEKDEKRPAKMMKLATVEESEYQKLINSLCSLLDDCSLVLSKNEKNSITSFIIRLIEDIAMATAFMKPSLIIDQKIGSKCLLHFPCSISRDVLTLFCDLSTNEGRNMAANFIMKRKKENCF